MREEVQRAREIQIKRYENEKISTNGSLSTRLMKKYIKLDKNVKEIGQKAFEKYNFSVRSYNKIIKMSRTIADLDGSEKIEARHLLEAVRYRSLDDKYWSVWWIIIW